MRPPLFQDDLDAVFFTKVLLTDEFDLQIIFFGDGFGGVTDVIAQGVGPVRIIEDVDTLGIQILGHAAGIAKKAAGCR